MSVCACVYSRVGVCERCRSIDSRVKMNSAYRPTMYEKKAADYIACDWFQSQDELLEPTNMTGTEETSLSPMSATAFKEVISFHSYN